MGALVILCRPVCRQSWWAYACRACRPAPVRWRHHAAGRAGCVGCRRCACACGGAGAAGADAQDLCRWPRVAPGGRCVPLGGRGGKRAPARARPTDLGLEGSQRGAKKCLWAARQGTKERGRVQRPSHQSNPMGAPAASCLLASALTRASPPRPAPLPRRGVRVRSLLSLANRVWCATRRAARRAAPCAACSHTGLFSRPLRSARTRRAAGGTRGPIVRVRLPSTWRRCLPPCRLGRGGRRNRVACLLAALQPTCRTTSSSSAQLARCW